MFRVKRAPRGNETYAPMDPPEPDMTNKSVIVKDMMSRGTTPPPASFYEQYPSQNYNQTTYYPNAYPARDQPQHVVSTTRYQTPQPGIHPTTTTTSETIVHQQPQTNASSTTKTSTRILDASALSTFGDDEIIEETRTTTTVIKPVEIPPAPAIITTSTTTVPQVMSTTTTLAPVVETTTIRDRPTYRTRRRTRRRSIETPSSVTLSDSTTSSSSSYTTTPTPPVTPRPHIIKQHTILPPRPPIETTIIEDFPREIVPEQRFIHHVRRTRTHSGYYSSDLDHGKRKVYKSDYKYRHYYYCNWCRGRCDLPNSSCSCCEWFYGCPAWGLLLCALFFVALLAAFITLLSLQPNINPARRSQTAETRLLNRTQVIYGFLQNCGVQLGAPTTLVQCANTKTTSTARLSLSSAYMTLVARRSFVSNEFLIAFCCVCARFL